MSGKKTNGSKRQSPSQERLLALALVRVVECVLNVEVLGSGIIAGDSTPEYEQALTDRKMSIDEARKVLTDSGFADLESIATRVARIEAELNSAIAERDGGKIVLLGAALDRAKAGKPPLTVVEKKPKTTPAEPRKPRTAKAVAEKIALFESGTKLVAANGDEVMSIKASATGKQCAVQFGNDDWSDIDPAELKVAPEPEKTDAKP